MILNPNVNYKCVIFCYNILIPLEPLFRVNNLPVDLPSNCQY